MALLKEKDWQPHFRNLHGAVAQKSTIILHAVKLAIEQGKEETIPGEVIFALFDGENPVRGW